ncbi:hypothetical protein EDC15_10333 [Acetobacter aceti NBRC 14818]|nr:hypothetical protein [Acetobacter aceti]TCS34434.1 hypothetical protein EDC15_10333 [Acetobacter aceti NBRC 14818]
MTGNTTATRSDSLSQDGTLPPVFRLRKTGNQDSLTTGIFIKKHHMLAKLKDWRRVATRYDHCARTFMSAIHIAAYFIYYLKECVLSLGGLMAIRHDLALERIQILVWMAQVAEWVMQEAVPDIDGHIKLSADMRYVGQNYELSVDVPDAGKTVTEQSVNTMVRNSLWGTKCNMV